MAKALNLENAFDAALEEVKRAQDKGMTTLAGASAKSELEQLAGELRAERVRAVGRGRVDRAWFEKTLKWVVSWVPESDLQVIAALGRIVRAQGHPSPREGAG